MFVDPSISTPREDAREISSHETKEWRKKYDAYLRSSEWRRIRDGALRRAGWKCTRCQSTQKLEVHHLTYVRLGSERPDDLLVLCKICHEGQHVDDEQKVRNLYLVIISDCLRREQFTDVADLMEAAKVACARAHVPYDGSKLWRAMALSGAHKLGIHRAPKPILPSLDEPLPDRPLTKVEALAFFREAGWNVRTWNPMPDEPEKDDYYRDMERANEIRRQASEMLK